MAKPLNVGGNCLLLLLSQLALQRLGVLPDVDQWPQHIGIKCIECALLLLASSLGDPLGQMIGCQLDNLLLLTDLHVGRRGYKLVCILHQKTRLFQGAVVAALEVPLLGLQVLVVFDYESSKAWVVRLLSRVRRCVRERGHWEPLTVYSIWETGTGWPQRAQAPSPAVVASACKPG